MHLNGKSVVMVVTGSIAAYKSAELTRELVRKGASVQVVMTEAATRFISPLTLQSLSGIAVAVDMFESESEQTIGHIRIAENADIVIVAPATGNFLAKMCHGIADDLASAILLAATCPVLVAPAMNVNMWESAATQENVAKLQSRKVELIGPDSGNLACGWIAKGRLADLTSIVQYVERMLSSGELRGSRVIVTAGGTREAIDPVRFVGNRSSGKMGFALAQEAFVLGANVTLISAPSTIPPPRCVEVEYVVSAEEMKSSVESALDLFKQSNETECYLIMAAAVCDHKPKKPFNEKAKIFKNKEYALDLVPNPDILATVGAARDQYQKSFNRPFVIVGFAAETACDEELKQLAFAKLKAKNCDIIVANTATEAFDRDTNQVLIVDTEGSVLEAGPSSKNTIAHMILSHTASFIEDNVDREASGNFDE